MYILCSDPKGYIADTEERLIALMKKCMGSKKYNSHSITNVTILRYIPDAEIQPFIHLIDKLNYSDIYDRFTEEIILKDVGFFYKTMYYKCSYNEKDMIDILIDKGCLSSTDFIFVEH